MEWLPQWASSQRFRSATCFITSGEGVETQAVSSNRLQAVEQRRSKGVYMETDCTMNLNRLHVKGQMLTAAGEDDTAHDGPARIRQAPEDGRIRS